VLLASASVHAASLPGLEKSIQDFALPNGLRVVVAERPGSSVMALHLRVRAGIANDPPGKSGIAQLFERLMLHGSRDIGTKDWTREKVAIAEADAAWQRVEEARARVPAIDPVDLQKLEVFAKMARERAVAESRLYFVQQVFERNGVQFRFEATADFIDYSLLMPANTYEIAMKVVGEWLRAPAFRYLQPELNTGRELARRRLERPDPQEQLLQALVREAFPGQPYAAFAGTPALTEIRAADVDAFFQSWFVPANMVLAVVGGVPPSEVRRTVTLHFGKIPPGVPAKTAPVAAAQPQTEEIRRDEPAPIFAIGIAFRRPPVRHADDAALQVAHLLLADTDLGLLREDVIDKRLVLRLSGSALFPGRLRPGLLTLLAVPAPTVSQQDLEKALVEKFELMTKDPLPESTVRAAVAKLRLAHLKLLDAPTGLALEIVRAETEAGGWKHIGVGDAALQRVTPADVQRVARTYFLPASRIVIHLGSGKAAR
jgi:predicted Zn-dependent peptidase